MLQKVKPGEHSLVIPLGAKAEINIEKTLAIYQLEYINLN